MIEQKTLEQTIRDLWANTNDPTGDYWEREQNFINTLKKTLMEQAPDCRVDVYLFDPDCTTAFDIIDFIADCTRNYRTIEQFACVDETTLDNSYHGATILVCITKQEL